MCQGLDLPSKPYSREELQSLATASSKEDYLPQGIYQQLRQNGLAIHPPTKRGMAGGRNKQRAIKVITTERYYEIYDHQTGINTTNLVTIKTDHSNTSYEVKPKLVNMCLMNTRSVRNKTLEVKDYVVEHSVDITALTETWLRSDELDAKTLGDVCPKGYKLPNEPRKEKRGGGVGVLHRQNIELKPRKTKDFVSFEQSELILQSGS